MEKPKELTEKEFIEEYKELCDKFKMIFVITPQWRFSQETGDFRLIIQQTVGRQDDTKRV